MASRILELETEIAELKRTLFEKEDELCRLKQNEQQNIFPKGAGVLNGLPKWAIERYSRQILVSEIGPSGQMKLSRCRVLIVGAGGLGSPAALYLAASGVGEIGLVDYDTVDVTNLPRQILYTHHDVGHSKVKSAAYMLKRLNPHVKVNEHESSLDCSNALNIMSNYDLVLDCTDNVVTRYLINDSAVMLKLPLISGSALKMEGQITIYGYRGQCALNKSTKEYIQGPCYRCLFPKPPPPETVGSCSANGVVVTLRNRRPDCAVCSENPTIVELQDYEVFCRSLAKEKDFSVSILKDEHRITPEKLAMFLGDADGRHLLVDVRSEHEYTMCSIEGSVNYPIDKLDRMFNQLIDECRLYSKVSLICRRGNDSQIVADKLMAALQNEGCSVYDVIDGLHGWSRTVDPQFPVY